MRLKFGTLAVNVFRYLERFVSRYNLDKNAYTPYFMLPINWQLRSLSDVTFYYHHAEVVRSQTVIFELDDACTFPIVRKKRGWAPEDPPFPEDQQYFRLK